MRAAEKEIGTANLDAPRTAEYQSAREGDETPITPNNRAARGAYGDARQKDNSHFKFNGNLLKKQNWAEATALNIQHADMNELVPAKYVEELVKIYNIKPNHIPETKKTRKTKIAADMQKIASTSGIKNVNWKEVQNHQIRHMKN